MPELNYLAILVAAVAAVVAAAGYYIVFGKQLAAYGSATAAEDRPPAWMFPVELGRALVLSLVVAVVAVQIDIAGWATAVPLAVALWIGFPVVLLSGSVVHEKVPWKLAALHAGDWLVKLELITLIVSLWR